MKKFTKVTRRFLAVLTAIITCFSIACSPVYAADLAESSNALQSKPILKSAGSIIAAGAGSFSGGSGSITAYLAHGNWSADIEAGTSGPTVNGRVHCIVKFPNGRIYDLGTIDASGDQTELKTFTYCPSGTYTFSFAATTTHNIYVFARIYD